MLLRIMLLITMILLSSPHGLQAAGKAVDSEALAGLTTARVVFDVRVAELDRLVFNLNLFEETWEGMISQGVKPVMTVVFRGPGVKLLTAAALDEEALALFRSLNRAGIRFEVCGVAMRIFKADPARLLPEVKLVGNGFHSLIGYQNKGFAAITIN